MKISKAVIPAAGYGTRLYPLTLNTPKALIKVAGKPILKYLIDKIISLGSIDEIVLVTNHKFYSNFCDWIKDNPQKIKVRIFDDLTTDNENRLGGIGDVIFGIEKAKINDNFLWLSSDNLFNYDLRELGDYFSKTGKDIVAVYDVKNIEEAKKMGVVSVGKDNKLIDFEEKPEKPKSTLCSTGIYVYTKDTIKFFDLYAKEGNSLDKPGDFVKWLYKKKDVYAFPYDKKSDKWFDIGSFKALEEANKEFGKKM